MYDYRVLPLPGSTVNVDYKAVGSWTYDGSKQEMISFDNEEVARMKGEYIRREGLGGSMFWELSGVPQGKGWKVGRARKHSPDRVW